MMIFQLGMTQEMGIVKEKNTDSMFGKSYTGCNES